MAELADAHGSGPCESNFMQVQVLLSAPKVGTYFVTYLFLCITNSEQNIESLSTNTFGLSIL